MSQVNFKDIDAKERSKSLMFLMLGPEQQRKAMDYLVAIIAKKSRK